MKVELLVNLKITSKLFWSKGAIFETPLPPEIEQEVNLCEIDPKRRTIKIFPDPISDEIIEQVPKLVGRKKIGKVGKK